MQKVIIGTIIVILGLFISLGPQLIFKVCDPVMVSSLDTDDCCSETEASSCCTPTVNSLPVCHWTARAEIGIGLLIAALGACMIVFSDSKTQLGLLISTFLAGIIALFIPHTLIGGCSSMDMLCRKLAFPALTAESIGLLVFSAIMMIVKIQKFSVKN